MLLDGRDSGERICTTDCALECFIMRKAAVAKRGSTCARGLTAAAESSSHKQVKAGNPDAWHVFNGRTLVEVLRIFVELRRRAGITGVAFFVGFGICLHAAYAHCSPEQLSFTLLALAGFTLLMILLQWFERWTKDKPRD